MPEEILPTFRAVPDSVPGRWELLRHFTENWQGVSLHVNTDLKLPPLPSECVAAGYPASFIEWCRFCDGLREADCEGRLRENLVTERIPGHDAVSLMLGGEGDCYWGILYSDMERDDPAVHSFGLGMGPSEEVFAHQGRVHESSAERAARRVEPARSHATRPQRSGGSAASRR
jgi:hypothetical protein